MNFSFRHLGLGLVALLALAAPLPAWGQGGHPATGSTPVGEVLTELKALEERTTRFSDPALAPDGKRLAWRASKGSAKGALFIQDRTRPDQTPQRVAAGSSPAWSRDSHQLAYLADGDGKGQEQIWTVAADGRQAKVLTDLKGFVAQPQWSPDGQRIACLFVPGGQGGGPLGAAAAQVGEIQEVVRNQRVAVVDLKSGAMHYASPEDLHVYGFDWSPDGTRLAVSAAPGPGDNNWWIAQLYLTDAATGNARALYRPRWQVTPPRWSPDGRRLAFIEGLMSDEGFYGGDLMVVEATGGTAKNLTPGRPASPSGLSWLADGSLLFSETTGGGTAIAVANLDTGAIAGRWQGDQALTIGGFDGNLSLTPDGAMSAIVREGFHTPPEVWAGPIGQWQPLTRANAGVQPTWGRAESLTWMSEGRAVQGWLIHPSGERPDRRYPLVVEIHGGPSGAHLATWSPMEIGALSRAGYFLLLPNPRGSFGQGEAFTQANIKDFGGGDLRDILTGVDRVLQSNPVDPQRLGVQGWSYGGYMTMWTVTQTTRFAAAVAGAGVANWKSYYGQNAIDQWMIPFFGASVYEDPAVYAKSSPIEFIKQARTPTLVLVGDRDAECPAPQSFEFWHALKALGVTTKLVVYPGEGHMFVDPVHQWDRVERSLAWYDRFLKQAGRP